MTIFKALVSFLLLCHGITSVGVRAYGLTANDVRAKLAACQTVDGLLQEINRLKHIKLQPEQGDVIEEGIFVFFDGEDFSPRKFHLSREGIRDLYALIATRLVTPRAVPIDLRIRVARALMFQTEDEGVASALLLAVADDWYKFLGFAEEEKVVAAFSSLALQSSDHYHRAESVGRALRRLYSVVSAIDPVFNRAASVLWFCAKTLRGMDAAAVAPERASVLLNLIVRKLRACHETAENTHHVSVVEGWRDAIATTVVGGFCSASFLGASYFWL